MLMVKSAFVLCLLSSVTESWNRGGGCRNDRARHLHTGALHRVPNLLRVVRVPVEEDELLIGEAQRLQIRSGKDCLRGQDRRVTVEAEPGWGYSPPAERGWLAPRPGQQGYPSILPWYLL